MTDSPLIETRQVGRVPEGRPLSARERLSLNESIDAMVAQLLTEGGVMEVLCDPRVLQGSLTVAIHSSAKRRGARVKIETVENGLIYVHEKKGER